MMGSLGDRLKIAREAKGLSQSMAADLVGISLRSLQGHESGEHRPGNSTIKRYLDIYGCNKGWLLTGKDAPLPGGTAAQGPDGADLADAEKEMRTLGEALEAVTKLYASGDREVIRSVCTTFNAFLAIMGRVQQKVDGLEALENENKELNSKLDMLLKLVIEILREHRPPEGFDERRSCIAEIRNFLMQEGYPLPDILNN